MPGTRRGARALNATAKTVSVATPRPAGKFGKSVVTTPVRRSAAFGGVTRSAGKFGSTPIATNGVKRVITKKVPTMAGPKPVMRSVVGGPRARGGRGAMYK